MSNNAEKNLDEDILESENKKEKNSNEKPVKEEKRGKQRRSPSNERRKSKTKEEARDKIISEKDETINNLESEIITLKETLLRKQADFENYKKRNLKQQEDFRKYAVKDFALDIINIEDDLTRAIEASSEIPEDIDLGKALNSLIEGIEMISKRIADALNKNGIAEIDALDTDFNPNLHEAVEIEHSSEEIDSDKVTKVHQKGYLIHDLLLRSSKVKVLKA